jgi:hypothetical protein
MSDRIEIIGFAKDHATLDYATQEVFRITSLRPGANPDEMIAEGERWDETQRRYRRTKPIVMRDGVQSLTVEFADEE